MKNNKVKPLSKKNKIAISVIAVILALVTVLGITFKANENLFVAKFMYALMPETYEITDDNGTTLYELYVDFNNDFDAKNDDLMQAFSYSYYDENGNLIDLGPNGKLNYEGEDQEISLLFMLKLVENFGTFKKTITKVVWCIVPVVLIGLIVLWFVLWSRKEDREKEAKYAAQNKNKNKKQK